MSLILDLSLQYVFKKNVLRKKIISLMSPIVLFEIFKSFIDRSGISNENKNSRKYMTN